MILNTSEYKYLQNLYNIHQQNKTNGELGVYDYPADTIMLEKWPVLSARFYPINYNALWIAADVQQTYDNVGCLTYKTKFDYPAGLSPIFPCIKSYANTNISIQNSLYYNNKPLYCILSSTLPSIFENATNSPNFIAKSDDVNFDICNFVWQQLSSCSGIPNGTLQQNGTTILNWSFKDTIGKDEFQQIYEDNGKLAIFDVHAISSLSALLTTIPNNVVTILDHQSSSVHIFQAFNNRKNLSAATTNNPVQQFIFATDAGEFTYIRKQNDGDGNIIESNPIEQGNYLYPSTPLQEISLAYQNNMDFSSFTYCCPTNSLYNANINLYSSNPTFCLYGNLSATLYMTYMVEFDSNRDKFAWFIRKFPLTFKCCNIERQNPLQTKCKILKSDQSFSFTDLCLWNPESIDDAKLKISALLSAAGYSQLNVNDLYYQYDCKVYLGPAYIVWNFQHPLLKAYNFHYTNQD